MWFRNSSLMSAWGISLSKAFSCYMRITKFNAFYWDFYLTEQQKVVHNCKGTLGFPDSNVKKRGVLLYWDPEISKTAKRQKTKHNFLPLLIYSCHQCEFVKWSHLFPSRTGRFMRMWGTESARVWGLKLCLWKRRGRKLWQTAWRELWSKEEFHVFLS